ncbi:hypothetical protein F4825DRAFT_455124 [Nemania diffusa]|nr:hypothetical protein F4825DRAFT_455124 [Nemania diffusa]
MAPLGFLRKDHLYQSEKPNEPRIELQDNQKQTNVLTENISNVPIRYFLGDEARYFLNEYGFKFITFPTSTLKLANNSSGMNMEEVQDYLIKTVSFIKSELQPEKVLLFCWRLGVPIHHKKNTISNQLNDMNCD